MKEIGNNIYLNVSNTLIYRLEHIPFHIRGNVYSNIWCVILAKMSPIKNALEEVELNESD